MVTNTDTLLDMRGGDVFILRGRRFERSSYFNITLGDGYIVLPVWNDRNREVSLRVEDTDKIEVIRKLA